MVRLITWNCCWKLKQKLPYILDEAPDIAIIQECSKDSLHDLPDGYHGQWLHGASDHGLGLIYREPYEITNVVAADQASFVRVDVSSRVPFRLIAAWNCPAKGSSYPAHLHTFLDAQDDWFDHNAVMLAGDLNSQHAATFDIGQRKHQEFVARLRAKGLVDAYAALRGSEQSKSGVTLREATHHHQWKLERPFHIDYVFVPALWLARVSSVTVGAPAFWSKLSDHSPVTITLAEHAAAKIP